MPFTEGNSVYICGENEMKAGAETPVRVLHVFGRVGLGGAESRIMDLYRNIDRDRIQFDFLVHTEPDRTGKRCPTSDELMSVREPDYFDSDILRLGGRIYAVPRFQGTNPAEYRRALETFFRTHQGIWKVVQGHMTSTAAIYLPIARKYGAQIVCSHVRSGGTDPGLKGIVTNLLRKPLQNEKTVDFRFTCTEDAGRKVYGDALVDAGKVKVIPNAINVQKFAFDPETRTRIRTELKLDNAVVIGHVGRFHYAKNHEYLLRVFAELVKMVECDDQNRYAILHGLPLRLMLLGEGELMENCRKLAEELHISAAVMFMNNRSNVSEFYQAMDYFCFPSRYEGLPGTVVEAQASGLQCLISDAITTEVDLTELVSRMSIDLPPQVWAEKIIQDLMLENADAEDRKAQEKLPEGREPVSEYAIGDRLGSSPYITDRIRSAGFDVSTQAMMMTYFYENGHF